MAWTAHAGFCEHRGRPQTGERDSLRWTESLEKSRLTDYVGELAPDKLRELDRALLIALGLPSAARAPY